MSKRTAVLTLIVGILSVAAPAGFAAEAKKEPPPVPAEPQNTSATYGDWILNCVREQNGAKVCEILQSFQLQGQQAPFARLAIGRPAPKSPLRITFDMAPNISFPSTVKLGIDEKDMQTVELSWRRCVPGAGCFADAEVKDDVLKRWKAQSGRGRIVVKDSTGRDVAIPFSFRGLSQALDGLAKS